MNFKKNVSVAVVAVGLMCSAGYAQADESAQTAPGSAFAGAFGGVVDLSVPGGVRNMNSVKPAKAEPAKVQPAAAVPTAPSASGTPVAPASVAK